MSILVVCIAAFRGWDRAVPPAAKLPLIGEKVSVNSWLSFSSSGYPIAVILNELMSYFE